MGELKKVNSITIYLGWLNMDIEYLFENTARLWWYPVETISNSEGGFERIYQGLCIMPLWPLLLKPGENWSVNLTVNLK